MSEPSSPTVGTTRRRDAFVPRTTARLLLAGLLAGCAGPAPVSDSPDAPRPGVELKQAPLYAPADNLTVESRNASNAIIASSTFAPAINGDGSVLAFEEWSLPAATPPVTADKNTGGYDLYVRSRAANTLQLLASRSVSNYATFIAPHGIDASGRYLTATSFAADGSYVLLLWDRVGNTLTTLDSNTGGIRWARSVISADGSTVAYVDHAGLLTVYTRATGVKTVLKGVNGQSIVIDYTNTPALSGDGKLVFFTTNAHAVDNAQPGVANALYVFDRNANTVSAPRANGVSVWPLNSVNSLDVSTDGRVVTFVANAISLGIGPDGEPDYVYTLDRSTQTLTRVSAPTLKRIVQTSGALDGRSSAPLISADGNRVVFLSLATNLGDNDTNGKQDAFAFDLRTKELMPLSVSTTGAYGNFNTTGVTISGDGSLACLSSESTNLFPGASTDVATQRVYCRKLTAAPSLQGYVRDVNNNGISGVVVEAGGLTAVSAADGSYKIDGLAVDAYTVHARKDGWTFGTEAFAQESRTVDLRLTERMNVTGYDRQPIVFVPGFAYSGDVSGVTDLKNAGYKYYRAAIDNSGLVPSHQYNARIVKAQIDAAKKETGRDKVILIAYSMGGCVSRAYLETSDFENDVSQFFDYGSPHWGFPPVLDPFFFAGSALATSVGANESGILQMTAPAMAIFNLTHFERAPGVSYHLLGGASPLWTTKTFSFKIPWVPRFRVTLPWPDTSTRNVTGWAMGALITGDDDGLFNLYSTTMLPGSIDRLATREVHYSGFGPRWYGGWDGGLAQDTFVNCLKKVLIDGQTYCGAGPSIFAGPLDYGLPFLPQPSFPGYTPPPADAPALNAQTIPNNGLLHPNETIRKDIYIEGGQTAFTAQWRSGTAKVSLLDPAGHTIDPAFAASIQVAAQTGDPVVTTPDNSVVAYEGGSTSASYYFPNAMTGKWTMIITGNADIPSAGVPYAAIADVSSTLTMSAATDRLWYAQGGTATITATFTETVQSATVSGKVTLPNGQTATVTLSAVGNGQYRGSYPISSAGGDAFVFVTATGRNKNGQTFERAGGARFKIMVSNVSLVGPYTISLENSLRRPGKYAALSVNVGVNASTTSTVILSGQLVDASGKAVAKALIRTALNPGSNTVALRFKGEDIFGSKINGPYTLTNVVLVDDASQGPQLAAQVNNLVTSAAYPYTAFEGNVYQGHSYEASATLLSWAQAKATCEAAQGHLVSIGSEVENEYVRTLIDPNTIRSWIGFTDAAKEGTFVWTTGEPSWFAKWSSGEPNNSGGAENWAAMYQSSGLWLDLPSTWTAGYVCEWEPKVAQWTGWLNRDDAGGGGDNESLGYFVQSGQVCTNPVAVQCRRVSDKVDWTATSNVMTCSPSLGGNCINANQPGGACDDFEVRFACPDPSWVSPWFNTDSPAGDGDREQPTSSGIAAALTGAAIEAQCQSTGNVDSTGTGETLTCTAQQGSLCLNAAQSDGACLDYRVRFVVPQGGQWSRWINSSFPDANGEREKMSVLAARGTICAQPTGIECRRVSDRIDAALTGEKVLCDTASGFLCRAADQADGACDDYEVRFYCGVIAN